MGFFQNMLNLNKLNSIPVTEYSCMGDELEYVFVENTDENRRTLRKLGMTADDYGQMVSNDGQTMEISYFALDRLGAAGWEKDYGFLTYNDAKRLNLDWVNP